MSLDAIGIVSENIQDSVRFYGLLGVSFQEIGSGDHVEGQTPSGVRIMLDSVDLVKKLNPKWKKPSGSGVILCFKQETPTTVNKVYANLIGAGFKAVKEPWDAFWGQRYCSVLDPDGNQVDIFALLSE
ncbi:MAG: VOC family protein [Deltaproteobacteria bacterium]|nr:VOC family protein [Deltaproteobacteria bacterium]